MPELQSKLGDEISIVMEQQWRPSRRYQVSKPRPKSLSKAVTRLLVKRQIQVEIEVYRLGRQEAHIGIRSTLLPENRLPFSPCNIRVRRSVV